MSNRKPQIQSRADSDDGAQFDLGDLKEKEQERERVPFSTRIDPRVYEKIKSIALHEDTTITALTEKALGRMINDLEEKRGEEYDVFDAHKINR